MSRNDLRYEDFLNENNCSGCWCARRPCPPPRPYPCCIGPTGPQGPAGPAGPVGTILGSYDTIEQLRAAHPTGSQGDAYIVGGELYIWDVATNSWRSVGNLQGPTGDTGPAGPVGTILGSYDTIEQLKAAHPTGNPGDAYLVGGELYVWDATANDWVSVGNLQGPTGDTGPAGPVGTILGSYDTIEQLKAAHPTGNPGDAYLVGGELYVWDAEANDWVSVGNLQGPTGDTGPTGPVGTILGSYDTIEQLKAAHPTGNPGDAYLVGGELYVWDAEANDWVSVGNLQGPTGDTGPVGTILGSYDTIAALRAAHPTGNQGDAYLVGGELYVWDAEANDWVSVGNLQGPTGDTGPVGTILGSYDTIQELEEAHPTGNQGDMYLVDGVLYVWDMETNSWRAVGNLRPTTESATIIPFASQIAPRTRIVNGLPSHVSLIGFGYGDARGQLGDLDDYSISISSSDGHFDLGVNGNYQLVFSLPFDMTIRSIAFTTGNWAEFPPPGTVYPYVQLYWAAANSNTFMPIEGAIAKPTVGLGPNTVPAATMRSALTQDLEINLPAGTRIAIGGLAEITGDTANQQYYLYYTGSIGLTRWVQ